MNALKFDTPLLTLLVFCFLHTALSIAITSTQGFTHIDEPHLVFNIFKFLKAASTDLSLINIIWPDNNGLNGPMGVWIYSIILTPLSYILQLPIDTVLRTSTCFIIIPTGIYTYKTCLKFWDKNTALLTTLLLLSTPFYNIYNHMGIGEPWYTLTFILCIYFITKSQEKKDIYKGCFFFGIALAYKFTFAPLLIMPVYWIYSQRKHTQLTLPNYIICALLLAVGTLPMLIGFIVEGLSFIDRFSQINRFQSPSFIQSSYLGIQNLHYGLGTVTIALVALSIFHYIKDTSKNSVQAMLVIGLLVPACFLFVLKINNFRYFYPLLLPATFLCGVGINALLHQPKHTNKHITIVLLTLLIGLQLAYSYQREIINSHLGPNGNNIIIKGQSAWRAAANYALQHSEPDNIIITTNPTSFYLFSKRPMALNPIYSSATIDNNKNLKLTYNMSGHRTFSIDEKTRFLIIPAAEASQLSPDLRKTFTLKKDFGQVLVFQNNQTIVTTPTAQQYKFDMRTIVNSVKLNGLQQPGTLIK